MSQVSMSQLDLNAIPKLVGKTAKRRFKEIYDVVENSRLPLYLEGPSGSGKTHMAMEVAKRYALENNVKARYVQLSPDMTKTSLILGLRLVDGSLVAVEGVVAEAMANGDIIIVDETTHTTQEVLLTFNSILDRTAVTSIGDKVVYAKDTFRIIFCSNFGYAGNIKLPQSFAQRVVAYHFDYPTVEDECRIARRMVDDELLVEDDLPGSIETYLVQLMRENRTENPPLSVRNVSIAMIRLALLPRKAGRVDGYFKGANAESIARKVAERILQKTSIVSTDDILQPEVEEFLTFVSELGVDKFRDVVMGAFGYYLDVDDIEVAQQAWRTNFASSII